MSIRMSTKKDAKDYENGERIVVRWDDSKTNYFYKFAWKKIEFNIFT